ncbi:MAG TPA: lipopolysaccharide heptosyltransferase II [Pyrinomonadaceae bacterium]|nr:lipopolysaccharide heptosyltransferase II [Pyrinomonadaceae bacterium]
MPSTHGKIDRVVVRGTNWVGDAVMIVPALRALGRLLPNAHVTLATRPFAKGIFEDADFLDDILICEGSPFAQARRWRRRRFDLAVLFQNAFEPALIARLARVPLRVGYATQGRGWLLTNPLPLPQWRDSRHESFYYLNVIAEIDRLLNGAANTLELQPVFDLGVSEERKTQAGAILRASGVQSDRPLLALCPGSINSRAKRWPAERYAALADRFIEELGAEVLLIGSPEELEVSTDVSRRMEHAPIVLTGKTDLAEAVAVLSLVDLLVTNDTGPAHIASALNRPTLVIFGPTNPLTTRPFSSSAEIVRHPPDCAPCMLRECPIDHRCMTAISPDEVFERAVALLERKELVRQTAVCR